jgi:dynein heavy chain
MNTTGVTFDLDWKSFTLTKLFAMELNRYRDSIAQITATAMQEAKIEKEVNKISKAWTQQSLGVIPYEGDESRGHLLQDTSELIQLLEDHAVTLQQMSNSPFAAPLLHDLRHWEQTLNHVGECLSMWMSVQRKWIYLEGIFAGSEDIRNQIPDASKKFDRVDIAWHRIMSATVKAPNVLQACQADRRVEDLRALSAELDQCQKKLSDYLERKRCAFPRFFFISDEELLSMNPSISVHLSTR